MMGIRKAVKVALTKHYKFPTTCRNKCLLNPHFLGSCLGFEMPLNVVYCTYVDIQKFNTEYLVMYKVQMHTGAIS